MLISTTNNNKLNNKQLKEKNKMNQDQITALAREYAMKIYPREVGEDVGQMDFLRNNAKMHISFTLEKLFRRYYLVEKGKVKQLKQCFGSEEVYEVIDMLFPEIAKEMEK